MIGERIKNRRIELGLSQGELAKILGYKSRSTINKIEKGINDITQSKVVAFARALNTTVSYLMGWDDTRLPHQFGAISLTGIAPFYCPFCESAFVAKTKKRTIFLNECGKSAAFYFLRKFFHIFLEKVLTYSSDYGKI